jgi:thiamine-phosphate pyrophosphorylase
MAARRQDKRPAPRLYLVTPRVGDVSTFAVDLASTLAAADIAAVLVQLEPAGERSQIDRVKELAAIVQNRGAALLLDGHVEIVARSGADGAHLSGIDALNVALATLKPARIAGAGGLRSRHDAMLAGEAGADYVMFGEPDDHRPSFAAIEERIAWWAELFEPPCVGYAKDLGEVRPLVEAGADFVAVGDCIWRDARGAIAAIGAAAEHLAAAETVA